MAQQVPLFDELRQDSTRAGYVCSDLSIEVMPVGQHSILTCTLHALTVWP